MQYYMQKSPAASVELYYLGKSIFGGRREGGLARSIDKYRRCERQAVMAYYHFVIIVLSGIQTLWLAALHNRGVVKWEPLWVIWLSWLGYLVDLVVPDAEWIRPKLVNGEYVDWTRAAGWMCTCPVLILFLVSMTTFGGREASVRVVPLYARATRAEVPPVQNLRFAHPLTPHNPQPHAGS